MFIQQPQIKVHKRTQRVYASAYYLILMRPAGQPVLGNNVRGYVRHVKLELQGQQLIGTVRIGDRVVALTGNYGINGYPITAPKALYDLGTPLPDSLYTLWNLAGARLKANSEQAEMILWGNAVRQAQRSNPPKTCYRCGNRDSGLSPCKSCEADLECKCDELMHEQAKRSPGVKSAEKFGTPAVGTTPSKTAREPGVKFGVPIVGVTPPKEKVK